MLEFNYSWIHDNKSDGLQSTDYDGLGWLCLCLLALKFSDLFRLAENACAHRYSTGVDLSERGDSKVAFARVCWLMVNWCRTHGIG